MMIKYNDKILLNVEKPGRYIGNEINICRKRPEDVAVRFAFAFPDVYEVGMSHNGLQILYSLFNQREDTYWERVFAPWPDMESQLRRHGIPLKSLETHSDLADFDFIGFTLQYELTYTNILNMLNLANIPFYSSQRGDNFPIICGGGPCAANPEPLADFFDFFFIGEAEEAFAPILDIYKEHRGAKREFLERIAALPGVYVPAFYDVAYNSDGIIESFGPNNPHAPSKVKKVYVQNLDKAHYPTKPLVPLIETVHNRVVLELFRGCGRGCRFCQAGFIYRPFRKRECATLLKQAEELLAATGHEEISLLALAANDYPHLEELVSRLVERFADQRVSISLPSLRMDSVGGAVLHKIQTVHKSSLTFAPEGGSQRLRDAINKNISEREIFDGARAAFEGGWDRIKLYFMVGLPTERDEDLEAIGRLARDIVEIYYTLPKERRKRPVSITISTSCFVPKPHTPFQWFGQHNAEGFLQKQRLVKSSLKSKNISYKYHDGEASVIEGALARGDRRLCGVLERAWELGARFDGWSEQFNFFFWQRAFEGSGLNLDFYAHRRRDYDEILPWDFIDIIDKNFLISESKKAEVLI